MNCGIVKPSETLRKTLRYIKKAKTKREYILEKSEKRHIGKD
ncbi:MAG: hypothetical protein RLZZ161_825 [Bacteroidota bacterium]